LPESLGMHLRQTREAKGLTIEQLSVLTKINPSFIMALENGRWDLLPGRVYLKTFTKLCAEALDLDVNELYSMIDGISGEKPKSETPKVAEPGKSAAKGYSPHSKTKTDYKLPITAVIVLLLIVSASIFVKTRMMHPRIAKKETNDLIPFTRSGPPKWERPWERPAADIAFFNSERLRLEVTAPVWIRVIADSDTVFTGIMPPDSGHTFTSNSGFLVSVGKNNRVKVYLNGIKVPAFGASEGPLRNYPVGIKEKNE
jgi:cytoskeleton protein RodZ